jgi:hypothetical protein
MNIVDPTLVPSPSNRYALSEQELKATLSVALKGDVRATNRLADYYLIYDGDLNKGYIWLERAGDAGDTNAREFLLGHHATQKSQEKQQYGEMLRLRWHLGRQIK